MVTKFTKGPWTVNHIGPHFNNPEIAQHQIEQCSNGDVIAEHVYSNDDANLIAAAPEMYEMLRALLNAEGVITTPENRKAIKGLLAEARGEIQA